MSEKRFKLIGDNNLEFLMQHQLELPIYDYQNNKRLSLSNALDLLNSFNDENDELKSFKQRVFDLIDKTIEEETQIAENIEEVTQETRPYAKAINRITIKTLEDLKWELQE